MTVQSWAPGHATLFFGVPKQFENPEEMGSIGGGINFENGVKTYIERNNRNSIFWNDQKIDGIVTKTVISLVEELTGKEINVKINHRSQLGTGYGFSTSGAGALSTAIGLNELYNTQIENIDLFEIAHKAEIINHTGLGSVVGQITGGIEFRLTQGGPKLCKTKSITSTEKLIIAMIGPLSTADVLTSANQMKLVTSSGIEILNSIRNYETITIQTVLQMGRQFMKKCGLMTKRVNKLITELDNLGEIYSSMAMIGEALIIFPQNRNIVLDHLKSHNIDFIETKINSSLPHVIK